MKSEVSKKDEGDLLLIRRTFLVMAFITGGFCVWSYARYLEGTDSSPLRTIACGIVGIIFFVISESIKSCAKKYPVRV